MTEANQGLIGSGVSQSLEQSYWLGGPELAPRRCCVAACCVVADSTPTRTGLYPPTPDLIALFRGYPATQGSAGHLREHGVAYDHLCMICDTYFANENKSKKYIY